MDASAAVPVASPDPSLAEVVSSVLGGLAPDVADFVAQAEAHIESDDLPEV